MKYVIVTGGVVSGLGKGITSSSIGVLLKAAGLTATCVKIDPYLVSAPNSAAEPDGAHA
jgi:CTP synthase